MLCLPLFPLQRQHLFNIIIINNDKSIITMILLTFFDQIQEARCSHYPPSLSLPHDWIRWVLILFLLTTRATYLIFMSLMLLYFCFGFTYVTQTIKKGTMLSPTHGKRKRRENEEIEDKREMRRQYMTLLTVRATIIITTETMIIRVTTMVEGDNITTINGKRRIERYFY